MDAMDNAEQICIPLTVSELYPAHYEKINSIVSETEGPFQYYDILNPVNIEMSNLKNIAPGKYLLHRDNHCVGLHVSTLAQECQIYDADAAPRSYTMTYGNAKTKFNDATYRFALSELKTSIPKQFQN